METLEGQPTGEGRRIAVIVSRFNEPVTSRLRDGAVSALLAAGVAHDDLLVVWVPGAFELPIVAARLARSGQYDAIVALGAVIRGETGHYDYVCSGATDGLLRASLDHSVPVLFGVLTCDDGEQAFARAGGAKGNKGAHCALDALRMADLMSRLPSGTQEL